MTTTKSGVTEAALVHDIPSVHPRVKYFDQMVEMVAEMSEDLTISVNPPDGKIKLPGKKSIEAVLFKEVPLTLANSALFAAIDPRLSVVSLPFNVSDDLMLKNDNADQLVKLIQKYLEPKGLKILGIMRGADTLFIMKEKHIHSVADLEGQRIRIAAPGLYEKVLRSLGASPVPLAPMDVDAAFQRDELDGISSSPAGWKLSGPAGPKASRAPGLIFYTYSMIANKEWFDSLPIHQQEALEVSAKTCVTANWKKMRDDDAEYLDNFIKEGNGKLSFTSIPVEELGPWKDKVEGVKKEFQKNYPDVMADYEALIRP